MQTETKVLINKCEGIVNRIKEIKLPLQFSQAPGKPSSPIYPNRPFYDKAVKPFFFENVIIISICYLIPSFIVVALFFSNKEYSYYLIPTGILTFLTLAFNFSNEMDVYRGKVKKNNLKKSAYARELEEYQRKKNKYEEAIIQYEVKLKEHNEKRDRLSSELKSLKEELGLTLKSRDTDSSELRQVKIDLNSKYKHFLPNKEFQELLRSQANSSILSHTTYPHDGPGYYSKANKYFSGLNYKNKSRILDALREVHRIQNSALSDSEKIKNIKYVLWTKQSITSRLAIGGFLGAVLGLTIFGTGGVGIAALGGAVGIWGWFLTSVGGAAVASIISNFEKKK